MSQKHIKIARSLSLLLVLFLANACAAAPQLAMQQLPTPTPALNLSKAPDHVVIFIEENKSYEDIIGDSPSAKNAKYINQLAKIGASLTSFYAFHHPSQPNYFEIYAGIHVVTIPGLNTLKGQYPVLDDVCVPGTSTTPNLGGLLISKHGDHAFGGYAENWDSSNPSGCPQPPPAPTLIPTDYPFYAQKHAPWTMFKDSIAASHTWEEFPTTDAGFEKLPLVSIVIPDLIHDMHSEPCPKDKRCTIKDIGEGKNIPMLVQDGDTWLSQNLDKYVGWAMKPNSLLIITWDESSSDTPHPDVTPAPTAEGHDYGYGFNWPQNHIPTILVGEMVRPGSTSDAVYNHYDLLRTIEDMYGLYPYLGGSANGKDINDIWK